MQLLLVAALAALCQSTPRFHAVVLEGDGGQALELNEAGECVGSLVGPTGSSEAAYWNQAGDLTVLHSPVDGLDEWLWAFDINDEGLVVGAANPPPDTFPIVWDLDTGQAAQLAFPLGSWGAGVDNDSGLLVWTITGAQYAYATFIERDGTEHLIQGGTGIYGVALNGSQQVTGYQSMPGTARAFRWSAATGTIELLDPPAGFAHSYGRDLDDAGTVVGSVRDANAHDRAVLWTTSNVPALLPPVRGDALGSEANAIGPQGWIVGDEYLDETYAPSPYAVLWVGGAPYKLDSLVVNSPPVHVTQAWDVNGAGQIVGRAIVRGVGRAVRLDPAP